MMEAFSSGPLSRLLLQQVCVWVSACLCGCCIVVTGRHHWHCGGWMQSLRAGPAFMPGWHPASAVHATLHPCPPCCLSVDVPVVLQPPPCWKELLRVTLHISAGMAYMHSRNGCHCALNAANIFVRRDEDGELHAGVGGFGYKVIRRDSTEMMDKSCWTPVWYACSASPQQPHGAARLCAGCIHAFVWLQTTVFSTSC